MSKQSSQTIRPPHPTASASLPEVTLEFRQGTGRPVSYPVGDAGFLVGTVPGCDLRLPGSELPPLLCLITRQQGAILLRKLAPTQVLLVNGQTASNCTLADGDRITLGAVDLFVRASATLAAATPATNHLDGGRQELQQQLAAFRAEVERFQQGQQRFEKEQQKRQADLDLQASALEEQARELDAERALWYQRREEIDKECEERKQALTGSPPRLAEKDLEPERAELARQKQELAASRQELADIRRQLYERYQERRDRLAGLQEAVNRAARKVQEDKRQVEEAERQAEKRRHEDRTRQEELNVQAAEIAQQVEKLNADRSHYQQQQTLQRQELETGLLEVKHREESLVRQRLELEDKQKQHQADLLRLDRLQGSLEERDKDLAKKEQELNARLEQLSQDSGELEEQVLRLEELKVQAAAETDRLQQAKEEHEKAANQVAQRTAALEGQQSALTGLRSRMERLRDELRQQEQQLSEQRSRLETREQELQEQLQQTQQVRTELEQDKALREQEYQKLMERQATLDSAVHQMRQAQEAQATSEQLLAEKAKDLETRLATLVEKEALVEARLIQLDDANQRVEAERQGLRERTQALAEAELARETLQEQLRRRAEELASRQKAMSEQARFYEEETSKFDAHRKELDLQLQKILDEREALGRERDTHQGELTKSQAELNQRQETIAGQVDKLKEMGRQVAEQRKVLNQERTAAQLQQEDFLAAQAKVRSEGQALLAEARDLLQQLPDLELRAGTTLERLTHAREQLKDHLGEVHTFARQSQDDLEGLRTAVQTEIERVVQREQALRRQQDEHRLAVAGFRQQLIDWQAQVTDLKRLFAQDATLLERKQAKVEEQARTIDETSQRLAQEAERLTEQERQVLDRRHEVDRHLIDMREWYRHKLRELAGVTNGPSASASGPLRTDRPETLAGPHHPGLGAVPTPGRDILSLTGPPDHVDRRLGELLQELELIDGDSLTALLAEARRQRRSLRQVLLASGEVTLYQMALIEAGNLDGLMLGPVRVIDRLRATPLEAIYRVFDPRCGKEAVLRHLAEEALQDAVRPDEYRQRFTQAANVGHPNLAATLEVLEIQGRPAVLQEWLVGVPSPDWPPLAAVPGVCFRLLNQAALGLHTAHQAGLNHGHLQESQMILTSEGLLKIAGFGEPTWLAGVAAEGSVAGDLKALGQIAAGWCSAEGVRRGAKARPLPAALVGILYRLTTEEKGYPTAAALLEDLDQASPEVPANAEAWDRLVRHVRDHGGPTTGLRLSA